MSLEQILLDEAPDRYFDEDCKILYEHIRNKKPNTDLLEIGSGISTLVLALALKEVNKGRKLKNQLISIDINKTKQNVFAEKLKNLNLLNVIMANQDSVSYINSNYVKETLEFVFIDSSHTFEQTILELNSLLPILKKNGYIFMHDTKAPSVLSAIQLVLKNTTNLTFYEYNTFHGLGLLRWK